MTFGIADNLYSTAILRDSITLGDRLRRVVGAFGLDIRTNLADDRLHIRFGKNYHCVHIRQSCHNLGALLRRHNWAAFSLESTHRFIGVNGDDELSAKLFRGSQVTHVTYMQKVKATVCQSNAFSGAPPFLDALAQVVAAEEFAILDQCYFGSMLFQINAISDQCGLVTGGVCPIACNNSCRETVAVPRFMTTTPPA